MQLHCEAKVFLLFRLFFEPPNSTKITRIYGCTCLLVPSKYLRLPWLQSFVLSMCFMLPSVPTPQNFRQITVVSSKLNKAFQDKTGGRNQYRKRASSQTDIHVAFLWAHECAVGYEETRRTTTVHCTKSHHIYFSLASWQFHMFCRCINIYRLINAKNSANLRIARYPFLIKRPSFFGVDWRPALLSWRALFNLLNFTENV